MPRSLPPADPALVEAAIARVHAGEATDADLRLLVKHLLAVLVATAPGRAVEVRVPPFGAVQALGGTVHRRGTPPAVVETDPATWVALGLGDLSWDDAFAAGRVRASGERSDLSTYLPLIG